MTANDDLDRQLTAFLGEGPEELPDVSFDAVRDRTERTRQRVVLGPWRLAVVNRSVMYGLGATAVLIIALVVGTQVFGSPGGGFGNNPTPTPTASATPEPPQTPKQPPSGGLPLEPFRINSSAAPVQVTVDIPAPGWELLNGLEALTKGDDGLDPPQSEGIALLAWNWAAGTQFDVYGDPCSWQSTIPDTPASNAEEIAAAFTAQAETNAPEPVDITVDGYTGKSVTLTVPQSYDIPGASREERFAACDNDTFAFYGLAGEDVEVRNAQGAGQIDELWILDVDGAILIIDIAYTEAVEPALIEEARAMAESATIETP